MGDTTTTGAARKAVPYVIPRNHKKVVAAVREAATVCVRFALDEGFAGTAVDPSAAWTALETYHFAKLTRTAKGWTVEVHGNLWYELTTPATPATAEPAGSGAASGDGKG